MEAQCMEIKYFNNIPIISLSDIFKSDISSEKKANSIYIFFVANNAINIKRDDENIVRQVFYAYLNSKLPKSIKNALLREVDPELLKEDDYRGFTTTDYYRGFITTEFKPLYFKEVYKIICNDAELFDLCFTYYQLKKIFEMNKLNEEHLINLFDDFNKVKLDLLNIQKKQPSYCISVNNLIKIRDGNLDNQYLINLVGSLALNSIIGNKKFIKTNKHHIIARMFGFTSAKGIIINDDLKPIFDKLYTRYHYENLIHTLETEYNYVFYSNRTRGIYVGKLSKISRTELIKLVETKTILKSKKYKREEEDFIKANIYEELLSKHQL